MQDQMLSANQVAAMWNVTAETVRRLTRDGSLPHYRVGSPTGAIRIKRSDAEKALIASGQPSE